MKKVVFMPDTLDSASTISTKNKWAHSVLLKKYRYDSSALS